MTSPYPITTQNTFSIRIYHPFDSTNTCCLSCHSPSSNSGTKTYAEVPTQLGFHEDNQKTKPCRLLLLNKEPTIRRIVITARNLPKKKYFLASYFPVLRVLAHLLVQESIYSHECTPYFMIKCNRGSRAV